MPICNICNNEKNNTSYMAREMLLNFRDEFEYVKCSSCGCLQLAVIPDDLSKYYPEDAYYSYQEPPTREHGPLQLFLRKARSQYFLGNRSVLGKLLAAISSKQEHFDWLSYAGVNFNSAILDLGCGSGRLLLKLQRDGFNNLTGADPFITKDILYKNGVRIYKKNLCELNQKFDFIMLNHSLEHMPDQLETLEMLHGIIQPDGCVLIRIPVVDCYAWRKYGIDWVALDAPRHIFLHTVKSMHILADKAGFEITKVAYDSTFHQFQTSEQYLRGLAYKDHRNNFTQPGKGKNFTQEETKRFKKFAQLLNDRRDGDLACFYLKKATNTSGKKTD